MTPTTRRHTSLQTCHRPALRFEAPEYLATSEAYLPQVSARLLNDPGLTDGARRCALKIIELIYRRNRAGGLRCTIRYLARCLGRSERAVQYYLAQLRGRGYVSHHVIKSPRGRMCTGILLRLLPPVYPRHGWPAKSSTAKAAMIAGVQKASGKTTGKIPDRAAGRLYDADAWALKSMEGVFRALMRYGSIRAVGREDDADARRASFQSPLAGL